MSADAVVRARIDSQIKARATKALEAMGLSVSDAIRLLLVRVAEEKRLPFALHEPNATTAKAIDELESGKGRHFDTKDALFQDLGIR